jgi:hypothetical protein
MCGGKNLGTGIHTFSKNLRIIKKVYGPEERYEVRSIRSTHKY